MVQAGRTGWNSNCYDSFLKESTYTYELIGSWKEYLASGKIPDMYCASPMVLVFRLGLSGARIREAPWRRHLPRYVILIAHVRVRSRRVERSTTRIDPSARGTVSRRTFQAPHSFPFGRSSCLELGLEWQKTLYRPIRRVRTARSASNETMRAHLHQSAKYFQRRANSSKRDGPTAIQRQSSTLESESHRCSCRNISFGAPTLRWLFYALSKGHRASYRRVTHNPTPRRALRPLEDSYQRLATSSQLCQFYSIYIQCQQWFLH